MEITPFVHARRGEARPGKRTDGTGPGWTRVLAVEKRAFCPEVDAARFPLIAMSDSARFNSPSRKSRFRAQGRGRPSMYSSGPGAAENTPVDAAAAEMAGAEDDHYEDMPVEGMPGEGPLPEDTAEHAVPEQDDIPVALRLTRDPDMVVVRQGITKGTLSLLALAALVVGGGAGYLLGHSQAAAQAPLRTADTTKNLLPIPLSNETQAALETAFTNTKQGHYTEARQQFEALYAKHPEWPSMEIEAARAALYQRDMDGTQSLLTAATRERPLADAALLAALLHLAAQEYDTADGAFAQAAATDPARSDIYYFWGENLRREGKPQQAASRFKSALVRNQYENVEPLYLLKYWISLVQADQEASSGEGPKIDASLASAHPTSAALFAGAVRALKAGNYKDAAALVTRAQAVTDPTVFGVIMRDPTFMEVNLRPEFAPFYK